MENDVLYFFELLKDLPMKSLCFFQEIQKTFLKEILKLFLGSIRLFHINFLHVFVNFFL